MNKLGVSLVLAATMMIGDLALAPNAAHAAAATTYYVSCDGSDSAAGTSEAQPWKTLRRASQQQLLPGDRLLLRRNCVWNAQRLDAWWSGTSTDKITIGNYGTGARPVIQNGQNSNVKISGDHLVISGLNSRFDPRNLVACDQSIDEIYGFNFTDGARGNVLRNSVSSGATAGVHLSKSSSGNRVVNNVISRNNVLTSWGPDPSRDLGAWGILIRSNGNEVAYNILQDNKANCQNQGYKLMSNSVEIYEGSNNFIHHNWSEGDRVFSELGSSSSTIASNNRYENNIFISRLADSRFITTRGPTDASFGPVLYTKVYNNSTYQTGTGSQGIICGGSCGNDVLELKRNILWATEKTIYSNGSMTLGKNIVWNAAGSPVVQFTNGEPPGYGSLVFADPLYRNPEAGNLILNTGSPGLSDPVAGAADW